MFTIDQIKATHAKVKSGADFPAYIAAMKVLGVVSYEHFIPDGHICYYGPGGSTLAAAAKWPVMAIAAIPSIEKLKAALTIHQQGGTDYLTFCKEAADAGVKKWIVDIEAMVCTYYDKAENEMLAEIIPAP